MDIDDKLAQLQTVNLAAILAVCCALIESEAISSRKLIAQLEAVSNEATTADLSPEASSVLHILLQQVRTFARLRAPRKGCVRRPTRTWKRPASKKLIAARKDIDEKTSPSGAKKSIAASQGGV
jgi:hypothetical protein